MHLFRRYLIMGGVILIALLFKFQNVTTNMKEVRAFRGAELDAAVFNPRIADYTNGREITVMIDGNSISSTRSPIYMDDERELRIGTEALRDSFRCSAHLYDDSTLRVMKYSREADFPLGEKGYFLSDEFMEDTAGLTETEDGFSVPVRLMADSLGLSYQWNADTNTAEVVGNGESGAIYPASFSLYDERRSPVVRRQGTSDTCWAFASVSAMESTLLPEERQVFSANNMTTCNAFNTEPDDGGEYTMAMAYLTGWQGPVTEEEDPYDGEKRQGIAPAKHVQEIQIIDSKNLEGIKEAVFLYGGVQTSIYNDLKNADSTSDYYNRETASYCYIGTEKPNHDVVIVGWDDDYPKENFTVELPENGAFLCQNSWGEKFGDGGCFYISYYDTNLGIHNVVYTGIEETDNFDRLYQTDLCGWVGQIGYGQEGAYGANVYTAPGKEELEAVGFYATGRGTAYEVFVVHDFSGTADFSRMEKVCEGSLGNAGFYTIRLDSPVKLAEDETYAVVLAVTTPGSERPLAVEYRADQLTETVDITDGQGYISMNGRFWDDIEEVHRCNLCLKAYTNED